MKVPDRKAGRQTAFLDSIVWKVILPSFFFIVTLIGFLFNYFPVSDVEGDRPQFFQVVGLVFS